MNKEMKDQINEGREMFHSTNGIAWMERNGTKGNEWDRTEWDGMGWDGTKYLEMLFVLPYHDTETPYL